MWKSAKSLVRQFKQEIRVYGLVLKHPRTPWAARVLLGAAVAYAVSPIDFIPDFIPVLGQLDDLVIVPALVMMALKLIPKDVVAECRAKAAAYRARAGAACGTAGTPGASDSGTRRPR
ncbi:MAG: DUF1232 domain-containing protein [Planctomycetes bacterium]|nr:DUF1232 domain-containing protein [Planctomycetota bacterium]